MLYSNYINKDKLVLASISFALIFFPGISAAALIDRGSGLIYDSAQNITWLANANLAMEQAADTNNDGLLTQQEALDWAANLVIFDSVRAVNLDNWRLPAASFVDIGAHDVGEMEALFYELGGTWEQNLFLVTPPSPDLSLFSNLQTGWYWGLETGVHPGNHHDLFSFDEGSTMHDEQGNVDCNQCHSQHAPPGTPALISRYDFYAWAVMDGDVAAVPLPSSFVLMGFGLAGLALVRSRKRKKLI